MIAMGARVFGWGLWPGMARMNRARKVDRAQAQVLGPGVRADRIARAIGRTESRKKKRDLIAVLARVSRQRTR